MNNVIILGKVISKSVIHFDYMDKLKAYFILEVSEGENIFSVIVSEKYLDVDLPQYLYSNVCIGYIVCVYGYVLNDANNYLIIGENIYINK